MDFRARLFPFARLCAILSGAPDPRTRQRLGDDAIMLAVYTLEQSAQWDAAVRSFSDYDVFYLSGYTRAFMLHGDGEPMLFFYEGADARGINVVMKRDVTKDSRFSGRLEQNRYFDFSSPYGYGGWLIEGAGDTAPLFAEYEAWCARHGIICEFVRYHPVLKNHQAAQGAYDVIPLGNTITMDLSSPEAIWANLTSKNRNTIRKAQRSGMRIYNGRDPELYKRFREINDATMDKDNADSYYYFGEEFYKSVLYDLPHNAQVFYACLDGEMTAASIMLAANGRLSYHLSGYVRRFHSLAPTNLLLYEAALWGYENGCRTFYLGGGVGSEEDSLYQFKKAFYKGEPMRFHIGKKIFLPQTYDMLLAMREDTPTRSFFPMYRA